VRPGENDYDACFRDWWFVEIRKIGGRLEVVTEAADESTSQRGLTKYASRLERLARECFRVPRHAAIEFKLQREAPEHLST
jgi:hypothetical protein